MGKADNSFSVLEITYDPQETDNGVGEIILALGFPSVTFEADRKLTDALKIGDSEAEHYFENTDIPNIFLWYEKGETHEGEIGTISGDKFRGFVNIPQKPPVTSD